MTVLAVGLSHRTAPVGLLERVAFGVETGLVDSARLATELRGPGQVSEAVLLSTCNRIEVYAETAAFHAGVDAITDLLAGYAGVELEELAPHLFVHWEGQAVLHAFEVACGLDSMVVGESQVLGQLRRAYEAAREQGAAGRALHELFQAALKVGKRAHTETGIDVAGRSLVSVGFERAAQHVGELAGCRVAVVGAGSMGALAATTAARLGAAEVVVVNRTRPNAAQLATSVGGTDAGLESLEEVLGLADVVVCSTGASGVVVGRDLVLRSLARRDGRPLVLVDLALPRDVDPTVRELTGVVLIDLADLQLGLAGSAAGGEVEAVRSIVTQEVGEFLAGQRASRVAPTVVALRSRAEQLVQAEVERLAARLPALDSVARAEVEGALRRVVDKLLHTPTVRVKELAEDPDGVSYAEALNRLFALEQPTGNPS